MGRPSRKHIAADKTKVALAGFARPLLSPLGLAINLLISNFFSAPGSPP